MNGEDDRSDNEAVVPDNSATVHTETDECKELHFTNDLRYRRRLVSCSDMLDNNEHNMITCLPTDNILVSAWEDVVPCPQYMSNSRKKKSDALALCSDTSDIANGQVVHKRRNYELDFVNCPAWRMGVEPMTYRYLPSNGRYRAFKLARRHDTPKPFQKSFSTTKLSTDLRHLQKEIQRELRKEFDMFLSVEKQKSSVMRQLETKRMHEEKLKRDSDTKSDPGDYKGTRSGINSVLTSADGPRVKVVGAENANDGHNKLQTMVPSLNMQRLSKEQGELYLEQVSSRLREMKKDVNDRVPLKTLENCFTTTGYPKPVSEAEPLLSDRSTRPSLNRYKRLPAVKDTEQSNDHVKLIPASDVASSVGRMPNAFVWTHTQSTKQSDVKVLDTPRTTLHVPHPLMYYPPDLSRVDDSVADSALSAAVLASKPAPKPTSGLQKIKQMNDVHKSRPLRLISEYKLRKGSENPYNEVDPETFSIVDTIRSSYPLCGGDLKGDDDVSVESRPIKQTKPSSVAKTTGTTSRFIDPRGSNRTPNYEDYAHGQLLQLKPPSGRHIDKSQLIDDCDFLLTNFGSEKGARQGVTSFLRRPRPGRTPLDDAPSVATKVVHDTADADAAKHSAHSSVRGNIMPEVMIRRAEIAVTSKRII